MKILSGLNKNMYSAFQESAKSSLDELFGKSKENQEELCSKVTIIHTTYIFILKQNNMKRESLSNFILI